MGFFRKRKIKKEKEKMTLEQLQQFKQFQKKGYISENIWSLDCWLCETFPKMLRELAETTHGAPQEDFDEINNFPTKWIKDTVDEINRKRSNSIEVQAPFDIDNLFDRWELVLVRMAYCFERAHKFEDFEENEYQEEYFNQVFGNDRHKNKHESFKKWWKRRTKKVDGGYLFIQSEPDKELEKKYFERQKEIEENKDDFKNEAMNLLKKYFYDLWD